MDCEVPPGLLSDAFDLDVAVAVTVLRLDPEPPPLLASELSSACVYVDDVDFGDSLTLLSDGVSRPCAEPLDPSCEPFAASTWRVEPTSTTWTRCCFDVASPAAPAAVAGPIVFASFNAVATSPPSSEVSSFPRASCIDVRSAL